MNIGLHALRVLAVSTCLAASVVPLKAQVDRQSWTPEVPLHETPLGASPGWDPSIACAEDVCLVIWNGAQVLFGTRVDSAGTLLDPLPFIVGDDRTHPIEKQARVLWNGEHFVVIWRSGYYTISVSYVDRNGELVGESRMLVDSGYSTELEAATNGSDIVIVYGRGEAFVLRRDGSTDRLSFRNFRPAQFTAVASRNGEFLLAGVFPDVWPHEGFVTRWAPGQPELSPPQQAAHDRHVDLVSREGGYTAFHVAEPMLLAQDVDQAGVPGPARQILPEHPSTAGFSAAPLPDGRIVITWGFGPPGIAAGRLMLALLEADGSTTVHSVETGARSVVLAEGTTYPGGIPVVWSDRAIHFAFLDVGRAAISAPTIVSRGRSEQTYPTSAATAAGWFTAWKEPDADVAEIRGRIVSAGLTGLPPFTIGTSHAHLRLGGPVLAVSGEIVLVTWATLGSDGLVIFARRYSVTGEPLDPSPIEVSANAASAWNGVERAPHDVVWNGRHFLAAWTDSASLELRLTRITEGGILLDPEGTPVVPSERDTIQTYPSFAVRGESTLLVWQDGVIPTECQITCFYNPPARVEAMMLDAEGNPTSSQPTLLANPQVASAIPVAAATADRFLVAWRSGPLIRGRLLGTEGTPQSPELEIGSGGWGLLGATEAGDRFFVVWESDEDLFGRHVNSDGSMLDTTHLATDDDARASWPTSLTPSVSSRGRDLLVLYVKWSDEDGGVRQAYMRALHTTAARRRGVARP